MKMITIVLDSGEDHLSSKKLLAFLAFRRKLLESKPVFTSKEFRLQMINPEGVSYVICLNL